MKFDYSKIMLPEKSDFFGSSILKPIIPIRIAVGDRSLQYDALVDSGADLYKDYLCKRDFVRNGHLCFRHVS